MTQRISSSSSFTCPWTYTVFLNFRGIDTRNSFTGYLYKALCDKGIDTFLDDEELQKGEEITPTLVKAIEESRIAIIIFSKNYASSTFCLEELVKIIEMMKQKQLLVLPVFYQVDPSDVRYQKGIFGEVFKKLIEKRFKNNKEKVQKWKSTLNTAAALSGWHIVLHSIEYKFIEQIIDEVQQKTTRIPLHVANYPVGLESRVREVKALLKIESNEEVNIVGIYGRGGIGKTTIACAVYNLIADHFEGVCFLNDIRENSTTKHDLTQLQKKLLIDILGVRDIKLGNVKEGSTILRHRLQKKKVLLILDDVNKLEQLQALVGGLDWFGFGSRIIITTRDKHLLDAHNVKRKYEVVGLNDKEALVLLSLSAFKRKKIDPSYVELIGHVLSYCNGLPLALEVIGSNLCGRRRDVWESALHEYRRTPNKNIYEVFKLSYDGLEENQQIIFLDLACFFIGASLEYVTRMLLHGRDLDPKYGIVELVDKSLITIDQGNHVRMHDLIRDMGREIVRQESPSWPGKRSRLWSFEDIIHTLEANVGSESIEMMMVNMPRDRTVQWDGESFKKMKNLRVLLIKSVDFSTEIKHLPTSLRVLEWEQYHFSTLSSNICPRNLVSLNLPNSCFLLDKPLEKFKSLSHLNLSGNEVLTHIPDISGAANLEELCLKGCLNLTEIHYSIGFHSKLRVLDAEGCTKLSTFPGQIMMKSLEFLGLSHCSSLMIFPEILGKMENLIDVKLDYSGIESLPFSIQNLVGLQHIWLQGCSGLPQLPSSILNLTLPKFMSFNGDTGPSWQQEIKDVVFQFVKTLMFGDDLLYRQLPGLSSWELSTLNSSNFKILPKTKELPSNKKHFMAVNCSWLTSEALSILLNVVSNELGIRNFLVPGASVPDWFHHRSKGPSLSFWSRKNFPLIALCAVVSAPRRTYVEFRDIVLTINGSQVFTLNTGLKEQTLVTDHVFMFDLAAQMTGHMIDRLTIKHGWNHVEISGITYRQDFVTWMGVYVYKWETNVEDISFKRPNPPPRRTFDDLELLEDPTMKDHPALLEGLDIDTELPTIMYYNDVTPNIWEAIWNMQAPPTIKVLLWEICQHDLPTCQSLFQRKICDSPLCPICGEEDETLEHLFLLCPWTLPIWFESEFQWIVDFNSLDCIEVWLWQRFQIIKMGHQNFNQVNALIGCICWAIWNGRNDFVFEGQPVNPMHTLNRAETMYKKYVGPSLVQQTMLPQFSVNYKIGRPSANQALESPIVQERRRSAWESLKEYSAVLENYRARSAIPERRSSNFKMALGRFFAQLKPK